METVPVIELHLMQMDLVNLVLCALVYRPLKLNKDFISEFHKFSRGIMTKHDGLLILGDFNIHVCCLSNVLAKDSVQ